MTLQLLREWPPGYGGVERVAHELAQEWGSPVFSLNAQPEKSRKPDPFVVTYPRYRLPRLALGRLLIPLPSVRLIILLASSQPLHGHLPSPGVLLLLFLAKLLRPKRRVTAHWHCFLERSPGLIGWLYCIYQQLAERTIICFSAVVTTSPLLAKELEKCGCDPKKIHVLPCCLSFDQEKSALAVPLRSANNQKGMAVLFIGRLDSYKRLDWLLKSLATLPKPWSLEVVGDGPNRYLLENLSTDLFGLSGPVHFRGQLDESAKMSCIARSDVLVLPSDRSNEAFGIVQLEAMAAAIPALAFKRPRSGMGWVGHLQQLAWSQSPSELADVLLLLQSQPKLRVDLGLRSRDRYLDLFQRSVWLRQLKQQTHAS